MGRNSSSYSASHRERGTIRTIPTRSGTYSISLNALDKVKIDWSGDVSGRTESIRSARKSGKKLEPIRLAVDRKGNVSVIDGRHRLAVARERGDTSIRATIEVTRGRGTWATEQEKG